MTEKDILLKQFDTIRSWTLALVADFTEEEAQKVAEALNTSLVWNLGHMAVSDNGLLQRFFGPSALGLDFISRFDTGSNPASVGNLTKDEVLKTMAAVRQTLKNKLSHIRPSDLNKKPKEKTWYKTMREGIFSTALHEGYHAGKIGTLRRFMGKPALFG